MKKEKTRENRSSILSNPELLSLALALDALSSCHGEWEMQTNILSVSGYEPGIWEHEKIDLQTCYANLYFKLFLEAIIASEKDLKSYLQDLLSEKLGSVQNPDIVPTPIMDRIWNFFVEELEIWDITIEESDLFVLYYNLDSFSEEEKYKIFIENLPKSIKNPFLNNIDQEDLLYLIDTLLTDMQEGAETYIEFHIWESKEVYRFLSSNKNEKAQKDAIEMLQLSFSNMTQNYLFYQNYNLIYANKKQEKIVMCFLKSDTSYNALEFTEFAPPFFFYRWSSFWTLKQLTGIVKERSEV